MQSIDLRDNLISSLNSVLNLQNLNKLENLIFKEKDGSNPICSYETYSSFIIDNLTQIKMLDNQDIQQIAQTNCYFDAEEDNQMGGNIYANYAQMPANNPNRLNYNAKSFKANQNLIRKSNQKIKNLIYCLNRNESLLKIRKFLIKNVFVNSYYLFKIHK